MKTWQAILFGLLCGLLGGGVIWLVSRPVRGEHIQLLPPATAPPLQVYVSGAVAYPGVYQLPSASRLQDAIQAAGGMSADADASVLNLAAPLQDGQKVFVPTLPAPGQPSVKTPPQHSAEPPLGKMDINQAGLDELEKLPGIGPELAGAILTYRSEHGMFAAIENVMDVPGIGPGKFEKIKELIEVGLPQN